MEIGENNINTFGIEETSIIKEKDNLNIKIEFNKNEFCFAIINNKNEILRIEKHNLDLFF